MSQSPQAISVVGGFGDYNLSMVSFDTPELFCVFAATLMLGPFSCESLYESFIFETKAADPYHENPKRNTTGSLQQSCPWRRPNKVPNSGVQVGMALRPWEVRFQPWLFVLGCMIMKNLKP
jgi:hypothetical protein